MTENEIKFKLEVLKDWVGNVSLTRQDCQKAIDEAIKALEEVQQLRAIGTIEEFKASKEKSETLKALYEDARKEGSNLIAKERAKAIDEFAEEMKGKANWIGTYTRAFGNTSGVICETVDKIAEKLKKCVRK